MWQPDLELYDQLSVSDGHALEYAAVEGVVKEINRTLKSQHGSEYGTVQRSTLVEHKSKRTNGFWYVKFNGVNELHTY